MAIIKCTECAKDISDKAMTCPHCGCPILAPTTQPVQKPLKQPFTRSLIAIFLLQVLCIFLMSTETGFIYASIFLALSIPQIILGIISIFRGRKLIPRKGIILGSISAIIGLILAVFFLVSTILLSSPVTDENQGAYNAALYSILDIRDHVNNPSSVTINEVYVEIESHNFTVNGKELPDSDFVGYYHVYIDFTADNAFGGSGRTIAYYHRNQDYDNFIPIGSSLNKIRTVDSIPKNNENMIKLSADFFNDFDYSSVG